MQEKKLLNLFKKNNILRFVENQTLVTENARNLIRFKYYIYEMGIWIISKVLVVPVALFQFRTTSWFQNASNGRDSCRKMQPGLTV